MTTTPQDGRFHLAWHQSLIPGIVSGKTPLSYLLVPEGTPGEIHLFTAYLISSTGSPLDVMTVNPLALASPRDPDLTVSGSFTYCRKETALLEQLRLRAARASSQLSPHILPTSAPPLWARRALSDFDRQTLWRAGGA